jgi:hypothetical protein
MATQKQINANRKNAKNSTGPKTPQGKAKVSLNALKHGLTAEQAVIYREDQQEFEIFRANMLNELFPETTMETMLADRIVNLSWRLTRSNRFQNQAIDEMDSRDRNNPLKNLKPFTNPFKSKKDDSKEPIPDLPLGRIAIKDFSYGRVLERLLLYERRLEHSLYKTLLEYQRLKLIKSVDDEDNENESN